MKKKQSVEWIAPKLVTVALAFVKGLVSTIVPPPLNPIHDLDS